MDLRFAVNTVAPYSLPQERLPLLPRQGGGRVINASSADKATVDIPTALPANGKEKPALFRNGFDAYAQSKLAVIMWTKHALATAGGHDKHSIFTSLNPASMIGTKMVKAGFGVKENPWTWEPISFGGGHRRQTVW